MARPNKYHEPKKEALAQTAFDLFLSQGYEDTTVTHIMKAAGLTRAGMYHYFSSKEEILDAAIDYGISQDIEKTREEMEGRTVKEKMLLFTQGGTIHNEMMEKLRSYRRGHKDSYASYRIRERGIHAYIPVLEEIIREGVAEGIYKADYPRQAAEFMVLLVRAISEDNILPPASNKDEEMRIRALLQLMETWFHLDADHMAGFAALFDDDLLRLQKERSKHEAD